MAKGQKGLPWEDRLLKKELHYANRGWEGKKSRTMKTMKNTNLKERKSWNQELWSLEAKILVQLKTHISWLSGKVASKKLEILDSQGIIPLHHNLFPLFWAEIFLKRTSSLASYREYTIPRSPLKPSMCTVIMSHNLMYQWFLLNDPQAPKYFSSCPCFFRILQLSLSIISQLFVLVAWLRQVPLDTGSEIGLEGKLFVWQVIPGSTSRGLEVRQEQGSSP